jgi:WASH complex subunit 7
VELMPLTEQLCDCSFLYFTRELIGASLSDAIVRPEQAHKLRYLFAAFRDAESLLRAGRVPDEVLAAFRAEMDGLVDNKMMKPLCTAIENDLRLHIHSARLTGVVTVNPVKTGVRDISRFLQVRAGL